MYYQIITRRSSEGMIVQLLEQFYCNSPLRETVWNNLYDDRSYLTEEITPRQAWFEQFPSVNPFAACFLASTVCILCKPSHFNQ